MAQQRTWDYGAPRRTRLLNRRYLGILPSQAIISGYFVSHTEPASLSLNIGSGTLIDQDGVVIQEDTEILSAVAIVPHSTYPRIDWIVAIHQYSMGNPAQEYAVLEGTPGSPPAPPTLPDYNIKLAEVFVPAAATEITQDLIYQSSTSLADCTLIGRDRFSELQPVSRGQTTAGVSNTILVRGGSYGSSAGNSTITVPDQVSPIFLPVIIPGNERIDIVTLDDRGNVNVIAGLEQSVGFAEPPNYPDDQQVVAEVFVNESDTVLISPSDITDTRFFFNLGGGGGGGGGATQIDRYDAVATSGQTLFHLPWSYTPGQNEVLVISSGATMTRFGDYSETSATSVTFVTPRMGGELISIIRVGGTTSPATIALREIYTATGGQTVFTLANYYRVDSNSLMVFRNGKKIVLTYDYTETNNQTVTLTDGAMAGDQYEFVVPGSTFNWVPDLIAGTTKSLLVNGGFKTWQRGNGPFTTNNVFGPDEWQLKVGVGCTLSVSPNSGTPKYGPRCTQVNVTKGVHTVYLQQGIESYQSLEGAAITFSLWVKCNVSNCVRIGLGDYAGTGDLNYSSYHSGGGDWEKLVITKTMRTGLVSYSEAPHGFGAWTFVDFNASATGICLDGGMLGVGSFSNGFTFTPINEAEDLQRCQRFYQKGSDASGSYLVYYGDTTISHSYFAQKTFATTMQAAPTVTVAAATQASFDGAIGVSSTTPQGFVAGRNASATVAANWFHVSWTAEVS
jgi:hypothetical protein